MLVFQFQTQYTEIDVIYINTSSLGSSIRFKGVKRF